MTYIYVDCNYLEYLLRLEKGVTRNNKISKEKLLAYYDFTEILETLSFNLFCSYVGEKNCSEPNEECTIDQFFEREIKRMAENCPRIIQKMKFENERKKRNPFYKSLSEYANNHGDREGFLSIDAVLDFYKQKNQENKEREEE